MKRLRVLGWLTLACVLACAGLVGVALSILRPGRAPAEIVATREKPRRIVRSAEPLDEGCRLTVTVRGPEGPLPHAEVTLRHASDLGLVPLPDGPVPLDGDGVGVVDVPCSGGFLVDATAEGHAAAREWVPEGDGERRVTLDLPLGVLTWGRVSEPDGTPIADATVTAGAARTTTDADGRYELWADPEVRRTEADAFGHESASQAWDFDPDAPAPEGHRLDLTLTPRRELRVWCAGLPDDACGDVLMQCTTPFSLMGSTCAFHDETGETTCVCPDGVDEVAVRGGGRAVLVDGDAEEAWLDFRDAGSIVGRVAVHGTAPSWCRVEAFRVPDALEDLPRGIVAGHRTGCEPDGSFRLDGLVAGDWALRVESRSLGDAKRPERLLVPRHVRPGATVDVGTVVLPGGGAIDGVVIDGVTGAPLRRAAVLAVRQGEGGERMTPAGDETDAEGRFHIEGLPAGTWTVTYLLAPQERETVVVREGQVTDVEVVTSEATSLDANGLTLAEQDGALVITEIAPESPAYDAGLQPGEQIVGVLVGGFDVSEAMGDHGGEFARAILGHYDGPGVTLVVEGPDGGREEVPLEW